MSAKFKPWFCGGCGCMVTREPWPHLDRALLAPSPAQRVTCVECQGRGFRHGDKCSNCGGVGTELRP